MTTTFDGPGFAACSPGPSGGAGSFGGELAQLSGRPALVDAQAKGAVEQEKQKQVIDEVVKHSRVQVADNFQVTAPPPQQSMPGLPPGMEMGDPDQQPPAAQPAPEAPVVVQQQPAETAVVFSTQIQPILARNCQGCHQGGAAPADLHLDSVAGVLQGSVSGKVIIPSKSSESLLYQRISDKTGVGMPPTGRSLPDAEIALIRTWIDQGAKVDAAALAGGQKPKHWAYVKPVRPALPQS